MKLLALGLFALTTGCAVDPASTADETAATDDSAAAPRAPRMQMLLTDAPGDFESVWVTIASISIESAEAGWIPLVESPQTFDLLTLRDNVTAALGEKTLAPGMYGQLRMLVESASVVVGGVESPLTIASGAQTGIKIPLDRMIEADMVYSLTLDYDAAKSVKSLPNGYLMTPVVHVKELTATPMPEPEPTEQDPAEEPGDGTGEPSEEPVP